VSGVLSPNDERSLEHKIPAADNALSASTDVGWDGHQVVANCAISFWWLPTAVCLHFLVERWPERTDTVTLALTAPAARGKSVPWRHHPGRPRRCPQKHTVRLLSAYLQATAARADRWNAVSIVTMAYMSRNVPWTEYDSYVVRRRLHGIN